MIFMFAVCTCVQRGYWQWSKEMRSNRFGKIAVRTAVTPHQLQFQERRSLLLYQPSSVGLQSCGRIQLQLCNRRVELCNQWLLQKVTFFPPVFVEGCAGNRPQQVDALSSPTPIYLLLKEHVFLKVFWVHVHSHCRANQKANISQPYLLQSQVAASHRVRLQQR